MPITAARMIFALEIASQAIEKGEIAVRRFDEVLIDMRRVREILNELKIENVELDDLVFGITAIAKDVQREIALPMTDIQGLGEELAWFRINQKKHKNGRERMAMLREGIRQIPHKPRPLVPDPESLVPDPESLPPSHSPSVLSLIPSEEEDIREEKEWLQAQGERYHPDLGPCNRDGVPREDGILQCEKCQRRERERKREGGIRSESTPDPESWLPRRD